MPANFRFGFWFVYNYSDKEFSVLLSRNNNKMQLVIEFIISKFIEGSTCFERHTAYHQEL